MGFGPRWTRVPSHSGHLVRELSLEPTLPSRPWFGSAFVLLGTALFPSWILKAAGPDRPMDGEAGLPD